MGSKTPVSTLQELLMRNNMNPQYDLIYDGTGTHEPLFKYELTAGPILKSIGSGKSKKEAKHEAARLMLEQIRVTGVLAVIPVQDEVDRDFTSPYEGMLKENAIGELMDVCASSNIPIPVYELIREEGPPHHKTFTIQCFVSKLMEQAEATTKKQAKQKAASKMLKRLKGSALQSLLVLEKPEENASKAPKVYPNDEVAKERYVAVSPWVKNTRKLGLSFNYYHNFLHVDNFPNSDHLNKLMAASPDWIESHSDPIKLLTDIVEDLELEANVMNIEAAITGDTVATDHVLIDINTTPPLVSHGSGNNRVDAVTAASRRSLHRLNVFFQESRCPESN